MSTDELAQSWAAHPVPGRRTSAPRRAFPHLRGTGPAHVCAGTRIVQIVRKVVWTGLDWTGLAGVWRVGVRLVPVHLR